MCFKMRERERIKRKKGERREERSMKEKDGSSSSPNWHRRFSLDVCSSYSFALSFFHPNSTDSYCFMFKENRGSNKKEKNDKEENGYNGNHDNRLLELVLILYSRNGWKKRNWCSCSWIYGFKMVCLSLWTKKQVSEEIDQIQITFLRLRTVRFVRLKIFSPISFILTSCI